MCIKNMASSTSTSETNDNVFLSLVFYILCFCVFASFGVCSYVQYLLNPVKNWASSKNVCQNWPKEDQKFIKIMGTRFKFRWMKIIFWELWVSNSKFMTCLQNYNKNFRSLLFAEFTQTQKKYPTFFNKISIVFVN